ncbi:hypothetical protein SUGI_0937200 [Cryptomeria japonica]|nr:hypothetical protein SUGI_0937200 [Cryptomeria japonica]
MVPQKNRILAFLEHHVETFDAGDEEEDLKSLVGKEELINNVMKSLETEIMLPKCLMLHATVATNSCCFQGDSAFSMSTSSSRISDPYDLNLGVDCTCYKQAKDDDGRLELGFLLSDGLQDGLLETSGYYGSEAEGEEFIMEDLSGIHSCSSVKELVDLETLDVWE